MTYQKRRTELETYFDRTAAEAWARLTSDGPVSRVRAIVRAGRDRMRETLLGYLPADLRGQRVLDAGCGTGALAFEAARRGAEVVAIDLSPSLIDLARERTPHDLGEGSVRFCVGDMLDPALGRFDYAVAMDSLIHYQATDMVEMISRLAGRSDSRVLFTFVPSTVLLSLMRFAGRFFPRGDRAPAIEPIAVRTLEKLITSAPALDDWRMAKSDRVKSTFYTSQAMELVRR